MCCHDKKRLPGPSGGTPCKQRPVLVVAAAPISSSLLPLPIWQLQVGRQGRRARKSRAARQWCAARSPPARTVRLAPLSAVTDGDHYHLAQTPNGLKNTVVGLLQAEHALQTLPMVQESRRRGPYLLQDCYAFIGDGSDDGAEREAAGLQRGYHAGALPAAADGAPGHEVGVEELHHHVGAERPPAEGLGVGVARVVEVHENELALPPRGPQGVGEAAPVEEGVVAAVLLLEDAEEEELVGDELRRRRRRRQEMVGNRGVTPPRGAAGDGPRQPLHDAGRQPRQGPGEVVARVPDALARASAAPPRWT
jgi:hypothetical protein